MIASRSLAILLALAASAHAGASRAWTAAKSVIPSNVELVAGANLANLRSSQLFPKVWPALLSKLGVSQAKLDGIKSTCGIDLVGVTESVAIAMQTSDKGTIIVALKGSTRRDLEACGVKLAVADHKTFASTAVGALSKYSGLGDQDIYVRWLSADTFAMATQPDDKDQSLAATKGGFADKTLKAPLASINTGAGLWGVAKRTTDVPLGSLNPKLALLFGTFNVTKGNDDCEVHGVFDDAQAATDLATQANQNLAEQQKNAMGSMVSILKSIAIKSTGTQVVVTGSPSESDLAPMLGMLLP